MRLVVEAVLGCSVRAEAHLADQVEGVERASGQSQVDVVVGQAEDIRLGPLHCHRTLR